MDACVAVVICARSSTGFLAGVGCAGRSLSIIRANGKLVSDQWRLYEVGPFSADEAMGAIELIESFLDRTDCTGHGGRGCEDSHDEDQDAELIDQRIWFPEAWDRRSTRALMAAAEIAIRSGLLDSDGAMVAKQMIENMNNWLHEIKDLTLAEGDVLQFPSEIGQGLHRRHHLYQIGSAERVDAIKLGNEIQKGLGPGCTVVMLDEHVWCNAAVSFEGVDPIATALSIALETNELSDDEAILVRSALSMMNLWLENEYDPNVSGSDATE